MEAAKWFHKAAEQNHAKAQDRLGRCYYYGHGVPKNYAEACKWALLAVARGDENAKKFMTILEDRMSQEQIEEGRKLAQDFKPMEPHGAGSDGGVGEATGR